MLRDIALLSLKEKVLLLLFTVLFGMLLFLSSFVQFTADDFCHSLRVFHYGLFKSQIEFYFAWSGRYFSNFSVYASLALKSLLFARLYSAIMMLFFIYTIFRLFSAILKTEKKLLFFITFSFFTVFVAGMPSLSEGLYWLTGSLTYTLPLLLLPHFLIDFYAIHQGKPLRKHMPMILLALFVIIGSNEISMLLVDMVLAANFIWLFYQKRVRKEFVLLLLFAIVFSLVVVVTPGNAIRSALFPDNYAVGRSILHSVGLTGALSFVWLLQPVLWLFVVFYLRLRVSGKVHFVYNRYRFLLLFLVALLLMIGGTIFPTFLTTNTPPPGRNLNMAYFFFLFLVIVLSELLVKVIVRYKWTIPSKIYVIASTVLVIWLILHLFLSFLYNGFPEKKGNSSFYAHHPIEAARFLFMTYGRNNFADVFGDIVLGRIFVYDKQMAKRMKHLKACGDSDVCTVEKLKYYPRSILFRDIESDPKDWKNICYAEYYHVPAVKTND